MKVIAKEGYKFLVPVLIAGAIAFVTGFGVLGLVLLGLAGFIAFFFRNPERKSPDSKDVIVAPADGRVAEIREDDSGTVVSIFMSIFNVHINRSPIGGEIEKTEYKEGKFMAAFKPEASMRNERNVIHIKNGEDSFKVVQIAGLIARRIVCWCETGDELKTGERFGLIRFGSRVDTYLPSSYELNVEKDSKVKGGVNVIARKRQQ